MHALRALTRIERIALAGVVAAFALSGVTRGVNGLLPFFTSLIALAGVAWLVSFATELLGEHTGPAVTGFLQSSLGNLPELFVVLFALKAGETEIALTSLIGSVLANALLVLGLAIMVGARKAPDGSMRFRARLPNDTATLLQVAVFGIVLVALVNSAHTEASHHIKTISAIASVCLLVVYLLWVVPYLRSDEDPASGHAGKPRLPLSACIAIMAAAGVMAALVSEWFIDALTPAIDDLDISKAFAGLVIVAIAGNAAENATGLVLAHKGQADLAISVVKNSVAQVAAFLFPALVLVSLAFTTPLTFSLAPVYIGAIILTAIVVAQVTGDGEATMFEGWALVAVYAIIAIVTLYE